MTIFLCKNSSQIQSKNNVEKRKENAFLNCQFRLYKVSSQKGTRPQKSKKE